MPKYKNNSLQAESYFPSIESQSSNRSNVKYRFDVIRLGDKEYFSSFAESDKCCYVSQSENQLGDSQCAEVCFFSPGQTLTMRF